MSLIVIKKDNDAFVDELEKFAVMYNAIGDEMSVWNGDITATCELYPKPNAEICIDGFPSLGTCILVTLYTKNCVVSTMHINMLFPIKIHTENTFSKIEGPGGNISFIYTEEDFRDLQKRGALWKITI